MSPKNEVQFTETEFGEIVEIDVWFGNNTIDAYLGLAQLFSKAHNKSRTFVFNSTVYQLFSGTKFSTNWDTSFSDLKDSIFDMDTVIVPQWFNRNHYVITVLKPKEKKWYLCDSLYSPDMYENTHEKIDDLIDKLYERENKDWEEWIGEQKIVPQQGDGSSCGLYSVRFAVFAMFDMFIDFKWGKEEKRCFRNQIANDILNQRFSG